MRSPADRVRLERALRGAGYGLLAFAAWARLTSGPVPMRAVVAADTVSLAGWTRSPAAETLVVDLARPPGPAVTAWLGALRGAGDAVRWSAAFPALAIGVEPRADPAGGALVSVAGPSRARLVLRDGLGALDSGIVLAGGVSFALPGWTGALEVSDAMGEAGVTAPDPGETRRAVVLGRADWESRFVVAALEERGWTVDARLAVAPGVAVTQGRPLPPDTATHAVVVVLDSLSGGEAGDVARFAGSGGGVVLGPGAAVGALAAVAGARETARVSPKVRPAAGLVLSDLPRRVLLPRPDAVVLERAGGDAVVAARRTGAGRVVQLGYEDTWRWRMAGAGGEDAHRDWWADVVAAAARPPRSAHRRHPADDPAPVAALAAALGPAAPDVAARHGRVPDPRRLPPAAVLAALACLLGEWLSRRQRGAA